VGQEQDHGGSLFAARPIFALSRGSCVGGVFFSVEFFSRDRMACASLASSTHGVHTAEREIGNLGLPL
jgi:hypothetical protein